MASVIIIGSGLGGLAAALRLRHMGHVVTIFEKQARPGGRTNVIEERGFRSDTGPTILLMKDSFEETYRAIGQDFNRRLQVIHLDPNYRIYYHDDTWLDLHSSMVKLSEEVERIEPGATERLFRFIGESAKKYELGMDFVTRNYDSLLDLANPTAGVRLVTTRAYENLYQHVSGFFRSEKLRKAFTFHSMFLGLSPWDALAMYAMITYADLVQGMHYTVGGIYSIIEDMLSLANEMGVEIRTGSPVEEILVENGRARGIRLATGETVLADIVVSNADLTYTYRELLPAQVRPSYPDAKLDRMSYSCSGYILFLGLDRKAPDLRHQALYFSEDYRGNLDAIFNTRTIPDDPSFHLNSPTVTDPSLAPPGSSLLYLLAPMPNLQGKADWDEAAPIVRAKLIERLNRIVGFKVEPHIIWEREYRPTDWLHDINAPYGTAFGSLAHGFFQSTYFRPSNKAPDVRDLYFVGQATYPGIGMPMVLLSARLLAERIAARG
jgi:phytoene desaturase